VEPRAHRRALDFAQGRSGRHQSLRDLRLHPQPPGVEYPDIQYHFLPMAVAYDGSTLAQEHGFQAHVGPMRSKSRGWVRLASPDPFAKPKILFNYLSEPDDWTEMRACVRLTREIFAQPAFDRYRGRELQPGDAVQTDEQIDAFVRAKVESAYHPSCSCKMGVLAEKAADHIIGKGLLAPEDAPFYQASNWQGAQR
jgi:choline dehydrogenase